MPSRVRYSLHFARRSRGRSERFMMSWGRIILYGFDGCWRDWEVFSTGFVLVESKDDTLFNCPLTNVFL